MFAKINNNKVYIIIFIGFIYSIFNSITDTKKYDKYQVGSNGKEFHSILKGDIHHYWDEAYLFKKNIKEGKPFLNSFVDAERSYLYPKFIAFYYLIVDKNIKNKDENFEKNNYKFGIPIIQSIIFYFILILFYKKISTVFSNKSLFFIIFFIALEPSMTQFHSSYWTESLYFSLLLLLFSLLINLPKNNYGYFFLGIFISIIFMQRSAGLFLILPTIIYLIINLKQKAIKPSIIVIIGYTLVILFIGYQNYKKSEIFYVSTPAQLDAPWNYLAHKLNSKKLGITEEEALKKKYEDMNKWMNDNEINLNTFKGERKLGQYKKKYFLESLEDNYLYFAKYHIYKSMQTLILPLNDVKTYYERDPSIIKIWKTAEWKNQFKYKIPYSFFIYIVSLIGLIKMILSGKKYERNLVILIFLFCIYHLGLLGWVGNGRYGVPNQIFYSVFFGLGAEWIYNKIKFFLVNLKINYR